MKFSILSTLGLASVFHASLTIGLLQSEPSKHRQNKRNLIGNVDVPPKSGQVHDLMGNSHERKQQTFNGIPVLGSEHIIHRNQNGSNKITGHLQEDFQVDTQPKITKEDAIQKALDALDINGNLDLITTKSIDLAIFRHKQKDHLVYKIQCDGTALEKPCMPQVIVDAQTGEIISQYDNKRTFEYHHQQQQHQHDHHHPEPIPHDSSSSPNPSDGNTLSSECLLENDDLPFPPDCLIDDEKITYDWQSYSIGHASDPILANLHGYSQDVIDFMDSIMGFRPIDNGFTVQSYGHYGYQEVNAFYDGNAFYYGDGDNVISTTLAVLDVVAHEIGHAVTHFFSDLEYYGESGALSEGFSDVMAAAIEAWVDGNKTSFKITDEVWNLGEDAWLLAPALRYMMSPSLDGVSTDHYSEIYRGYEDNGGVHWNSGILNHFFYLLTVGGKHHNERFQTASTVDGIGMGEAFTIVSAANMYYFTAYSNFADARDATINACEDYFLDTPSTCDNVKKAWAEVGVGCVIDDQCKVGSPCAITSCLPDGSCLDEGRDESCSPCQDGELHIGIDLTTGDYGSDTYWYITESLFNQPVHEGGQWPNYYEPNRQYTLDYCVPRTACYEVSIVSTGEYTVYADGVQIGSGGDEYSYTTDTVEIPCDVELDTFDIELDFWFDYYAWETYWYVTTEYNGEIVNVATSGYGYAKEDALEHKSQNVTLYARACYDLYIYDTHGDGMCCDYGEGNFTVKMGGDTILSGDAFGYSKHVRIGACEEECPSGEKGFKLKLKTDNFGSETHWSVTNSLGEVLLRTQGTYTSRTENAVGYCLPENDCYNFTITDDNGDGICCYSGDGSYSVGWDGLEVAAGGTFGHHESVMFGGDCSASLNTRRTLSEQTIDEKRKLLGGKQKDSLLRGNKLKGKNGSEKTMVAPKNTVRVIDTRRRSSSI